MHAFEAQPIAHAMSTRESTQVPVAQLGLEIIVRSVIGSAQVAPVGPGHVTSVPHAPLMAH